MTVTAFLLTGCGNIRKGEVNVKESEKTVTAASEESQTDKAPEPIRIVETEPETQKLITSVDYTSKDGTVRITLPDNTWKVTQDADEMRVFSSGNDAMINIVHASTESAMKTLSIQTNEDDLKAALTKQYSDPTAYDVVSFDTQTVGDVQIYRYVVRYNAAARMWAYSVTYGIVAKDQAYVITGTVTDDNSTLLKAVEDSVDSFMVLKDEELKSVTGNQITGTTTAGTPETNAAVGADSAVQLQSLQDYGTTVTLYSNDMVNVRSGPGTDSNIIGGFAKGDAVSVTGETSGWFQVSVGGQTGYVRKDFLVYGQTQTDAATDDSTTDDSMSAQAQAEIATQYNYGESTTLYATEGVNIRSQPSTDGDVSGALNGGTAVTVIGETDNWYIISTGNGTAYVSKSYLSSTAPASSGDADDNQGSTGYVEDNGTSTNTSTDTSTNTGSTSVISGVVTSTGPTTVTITGDDGNTYTIYTEEATLSTSDGALYNGMYISASINDSYTAEDGTRYATNISG